jgi:hypothetical protein
VPREALTGPEADVRRDDVVIHAYVPGRDAGAPLVGIRVTVRGAKIA